MLDNSREARHGEHLGKELWTWSFPTDGPSCLWRSGAIGPLLCQRTLVHFPQEDTGNARQDHLEHEHATGNAKQDHLELRAICWQRLATPK